MFGLGKTFSTRRLPQADRGAAVPVGASWSEIRMSVDEIAAGANIQLQVAFDAMFRAGKAPKDAAMFGNRLHASDYTYYFSPGAARFFSVVMAGFGARDCVAPDRDAVSLLVGNADAMTSLLQSGAGPKGS